MFIHLPPKLISNIFSPHIPVTALTVKHTQTRLTASEQRDGKQSYRGQKDN